MSKDTINISDSDFELVKDTVRDEISEFKKEYAIISKEKRRDWIVKLQILDSESNEKIVRELALICLTQ